MLYIHVLLYSLYHDTTLHGSLPLTIIPFVSLVYSLPPFLKLPSGRKRKVGFRKKSRSAITVHRSEEILPTGSRHLMRQSSSQSSGEEFEGEGERCSKIPKLGYFPIVGTIFL